ncbi:MAG: helix-turn-helix domain-containing protein [Prevotella sp.]|nr:helix-turn-helix domain-containing protein [Prevotella sp.]
MAKRLIFTYIFPLLFSLGLSLFPRSVTAHRHFSTIDGLQGNTIKAMVQDDDGFIWMGGTGGLNRFDGYNFADFTRVGLDPNALTSRHIGLLDLDRRHRLLWTTTSTYSHGCLNLRTGRYEDYTGEGDMNRTFDKYLFTGEEMWLYNKGFGVRHIVVEDGRFTKTDYTRENGRMPDNSMLSLIEDGRHGVWGITEHRVFRISQDGTYADLGQYPQLFSIKGQGDRVCVVTGSNDVVVYDLQGRVVRKAHLPVAQGIISEVTHSIISQNQLYIFTPKETFALDLGTGTFAKPVSQIPGGVNQGSVEDCQFVANKQSGILWMFPDKGQPQRLDLLPNIGPNADKGRIFNVVKDYQGRYVIASYGGGLFVYDPKDRSTQHFTAEDDDPLFYSNYLYAIMTDATGCVWVAAESAGVSCIVPHQEASAEYVYPHPGLKGDRSNYIRSVIRTKGDDILLGTNDNKLYRYDPATGRLTLGESVKAEIYAYLVDSFGREWRGTRGDGLYVDGQHYAKDDAAHPVPVNDFYDIKEDARHRVWVASWKGGLLCAQNTTARPLAFRQLLMQNYNASKIHDLELSPDGYLYIATYDGLYAVDTRKANITQKDFIVYNVDNGQLPANEIYCLKMGANGHLWVGCLGNGALECTFSTDHRTLTYKAITRDNGLANNNVLGITEDANHHLWLTTEQGITELDSHYNTRTFQFSKNILSNSYSENSGLLLPDGRILFGTMNGLCIVSHTDRATPGQAKSHIPVITDLLIDGKSVYHLSGDAPAIVLNDARRIDLNHNQNTLSINFSNFNYRDMESTLYQFYLKGVDHGWRPVTNASHADYGELRPGRYVFHLKSANNGVWSEETQMILVIHQPWYNTWWAWTIYLCIIGAIAYWLYRQWQEKLQLRQEMKLERQTNEYRQYRLADEIMRNFRPEDYKDSRVVIVESNEGERKDIEREIGAMLQTVALATGSEALAEIGQRQPALLIVDERLNDMSGYDFIVRVKQDEATASIPVIMLTQLAETMREDDDDNKQMESYEAGADDFLPKPYNLRLLLARAIQLISWNTQAEEPESATDTNGVGNQAEADGGAVEAPVIGQSAAETPASEPELSESEAAAAPQLSERDQRFKRQLDFLIAQHLSDHDYTIDDLASALQMGHTKFYGRVKEVTAMSPNKYMMEKRMATAAELILDGQHNISEISYKVGFLDQGYFNKCFKRQYGIAPSRYGK